MDKEVIFCCKIYVQDLGCGKTLAGHVNVAGTIESGVKAASVLVQIVNDAAKKFGCQAKDVHIENMITL